MRNLIRAAVLLAAGGLTTMLATSAAIKTSAQARLAALPTTVPAPPDNPTTPDRVALGRLLFWDPVLSGPKDVSCATCHHPALGYADGLDLSSGVSQVKRNSQSVLNAAFNGLTATAEAIPAAAPMFWDLRVRSLELQALEPLKAAEEMRGSAYAETDAVARVVARLNATPEYRRLFARAFGGSQPVTAQNLGRALAAFQRTLVAANSPFDRYMRGDSSAMTAEQIEGMERFQSVGCVNCHNGPMLSDFAPHVLSVPDNRKLTDSDSGVNKTYGFRTASLRNLSATAPYMHNGVFRSLPDVIDFYQRISGRGRRGGDGGGGFGRGGGRGGNPNVSGDQIDPLARQLNLRGRGQREIVAFLRALEDSDFDRTIPSRVPSGLAVGGKVRH
jgi:cytochrome c peroxidase